jgi:hypothetical protein
MKTHQWLLGLALTSLVAPPTFCQEVQVGGQVRPRAEFRDPTANGNDGFASMRVRAQVSATLPKHVRFLIQVQDVRFWGEESNTLSDFRADNFDLHQGYFEVRSAAEGGIGARIGRQEVNFGGQRLVGAVGWTQQGRAFDGLRGSSQESWGTIDVIAFKLAETTAPDIDHDAELVGAYAQVANIGGGSLDFYGLFNHESGQATTDQLTVGARLAGRVSGVVYRAEGTYQTGDRADVEVSAFMFGARVGTTIGQTGSVTVWYDYLSGDDDPADDKIKVFDTLFATNHKFYGFADLFLNIPVHTGGLGLQDAALKGSVRPREDVTLNLDLHTFRLAKDGGLGSQRLGEEIDFTGNYRFSPNLTATGGLSRVFSGEALEALGRLSDDMTFAYLMLNATF